MSESPTIEEAMTEIAKALFAGLATVRWDKQLDSLFILTPEKTKAMYISRRMMILNAEEETVLQMIVFWRKLRYGA